MNQLVSCKSSSAFLELHFEKWGFRDSETCRDEPKMCPTGGKGCSQWGHHGEQQEGVYGFIIQV